MVLSGKVPGAIARALTAHTRELFGNGTPDDIDIWAVHPGGRSVLDAVEGAFALGAAKLAASRAVLRDFGNMSSATILFVLARIMRDAGEGAGRGLAMAFGPGLTAETLNFHKLH